MKTKKRTIFAATLIIGLLTATGANAATCPSSGCGTDWLNVPGDFAQTVNNFSMYLLGGQFNVDASDGAGGWWGVGGATLDTTGYQINFTATQFNHIGPGHGSSSLSATLNHVVLGSSDFYGMTATVYVDGNATGALVDNGDGTGHWTLNTHIFADWGPNKGIDMGIVPLSTNAAYSFNVNDMWTGDEYNDTAVGSAMNYHTGLAYMAGQGVMQNGPFAGLRVTFGLQGQDPLVAPVPLPAAAWLLGSGLLGLVGVARRKAA